VGPAATKPPVEPTPAAEVRPAVEPVETPAATISQPTEALAPAETPATKATEESPKTVTLQQMRDSWPEILEVVQKAKRNAWMVVYTSQARALDGDVLTLTFPNETDVASFKQPQGAGEGVSEYLRKAIVEVLGLRVKFIARVEPTLATAAQVGAAPANAGPANPGPTSPAPTTPVRTTAPSNFAPADEGPSDEEPEPIEPDLQPDVDEGGWAVVQIPTSETPMAIEPQRAETRPSQARAAQANAAQANVTQSRTAPSRTAQPKAADAPIDAPTAAPNVAPTRPAEPQRYGESVVREILGASFIEEQIVVPRVIPRGDG
jgi:DNA polymerase-3 subunit gamma/tau